MFYSKQSKPEYYLKRPTVSVVTVTVTVMSTVTRHFLVLAYYQHCSSFDFYFCKLLLTLEVFGQVLEGNSS